MSTCQLCGQVRECRLKQVDTSSCHEYKKKRVNPFNKLSKSQGSALLSVCVECQS